jgi:hypothetical protein
VNSYFLRNGDTMIKQRTDYECLKYACENYNLSHEEIVSMKLTFACEHLDYESALKIACLCIMAAQVIEIINHGGEL